jgi:hypothetical protein
VGFGGIQTLEALVDQQAPDSRLGKAECGNHADGAGTDDEYLCG